jgi:hypothetical protein
VKIRNINPLGAVELPLLGRSGDNPLGFGEEFEVDAETAGREPGTWREPTNAERAENFSGLVRREVGEAPDIRTEVLCPGVGLLSQVGNYQRVPPPTPTPGKNKAPNKATVTGQEN